MRGDIVYRVYGVHAGREQDQFFGAFPTRAEAESEVARLSVREMNGQNWAEQYHDQGFVLCETSVETDFEIPSPEKPRDKYAVRWTAKPNRPGTWDSTLVEVYRRASTTSNVEKICEYERSYAMLQTFEPFRQGAREFALISTDYTRTSIVDLQSGQVIAEESEKNESEGFCSVGFYVPDWWDVNDGSVIPGSEYWDADYEWPTGDFGFVWGCVWGDDSSWKVQYLDLSQVQQGIIHRDGRFGYVELATDGHVSPSLSMDTEPGRRSAPHFINVEKSDGTVAVRFAVEMRFDLESGQSAEWQRGRISNFE